MSKKKFIAAGSIFSKTTALLLLIGVLVSALYIGYILPYNNELNAVQDDPRLASLLRNDIEQDLAVEVGKSRSIVMRLAAEDTQIKGQDDIDDRANRIRIDLAQHQYGAAREKLRRLQKKVEQFNAKSSEVIVVRQQQKAADELRNRDAALAQPEVAAREHTIPIVMYHHAPADFEQQLETLKSKGYTSVDLDQVSAAIAGQRSLPAKPVVVTIDDGYSDQNQMFDALIRQQMKATFYIITGGEASQWCIGADRKYDQGYSCGDSYLNWNEIRRMDKTGLIAIGSHTVDHLALAHQSLDSQRFQLSESKRQIEAQLGHPIRHVAYPTGSFSGDTIRIARELGYSTAVSTIGGEQQSGNTLYELRRTSTIVNLP